MDEGDPVRSGQLLQQVPDIDGDFTSRCASSRNHDTDLALVAGALLDRLTQTNEILDRLYGQPKASAPSIIEVGTRLPTLSDRRS